MRSTITGSSLRLLFLCQDAFAIIVERRRTSIDGTARRFVVVHDVQLPGLDPRPAQAVPYPRQFPLGRQRPVGRAQEAAQVSLPDGARRPGVMEDDPRQVVGGVDDRPELVARDAVVEEGKVERTRYLCRTNLVMPEDRKKDRDAAEASSSGE